MCALLAVRGVRLRPRGAAYTVEEARALLTVRDLYTKPTICPADVGAVECGHEEWKNLGSVPEYRLAFNVR